MMSSAKHDGGTPSHHWTDQHGMGGPKDLVKVGVAIAKDVGKWLSNGGGEMSCWSGIVQVSWYCCKD